MLTRDQLDEFCEGSGACAEAKEWMKSHPSYTPENLWCACPDGYWMWWLIDWAWQTEVPSGLPREARMIRQMSRLINRNEAIPTDTRAAELALSIRESLRFGEVEAAILRYFD
jgi:hypothetical protein